MIEIRLPSLAERREDLPLLVKYFIDRFATKYAKPVSGITRRAEAAIMRHPWTGNVRELENVIGYACMMTDSTQVDACDLPPNFPGGSKAAATGSVEMISLAELERSHAHRVLHAVGGDKLQAAEILGVSRATLYRLLQARAGVEQRLDS